MKELLEELFSKYHQDVYRYLYSMSHDVFLSEDLTSDVFLEVMKSIAGFRGDSDIKTWLFSIARHQWYAYLKRNNRQVKTESLELLYDSELTDELAADENELVQLIDGWLEEENEMTRKVFQLRVDGYSYCEIASALKISENSARVIFFRIKAKIKKKLEKEGYTNA